MRKNLLGALGAACLLAAPPALGQSSVDGVLKIAVIADMSGVYSRHGGPGAVAATEMAVADFGGQMFGKPIQVVSADYQNKVDVTTSQARRWINADKVDMILESTDSASALALFRLGDENKVTVFAVGSATTGLTNQGCTPYGVHYAYDTYALATGTGRAIVKGGGKDWFFITADYAFGHALDADTTKVVLEEGGKVLGRVRHPLTTMDFSSFLLQAQASGAKIIGLANAGGDFVNSVKQAREFGLTQSASIAAMLVFIHDVKALGLDVAQGMQFTTGFYWDMNDETRAFAKRFYDKIGTMPSMVQAGAYSATRHYLNAVKAVGSEDADKVGRWMRDNPINDFFAKGGKIREDGRMVHDMYLARAKKPSESKADWDLMTIERVIPGEEAFKPLAESTCRLVKK